MEYKSGELRQVSDEYTKTKDELDRTQVEYMEIDEKYQIEVQRREWLGNEREKLNAENIDLKSRLENQYVQNDTLLRRTNQLE